MKKIFEILVIYPNKIAWYIILSPYYIIRAIIHFIFKVNQIKCPKCNTWFKKGEPVREDFLGTKTVRRRKTDVDYIRVDGGEKHKIEHTYHVNEEQSNYRSYYNCPKCQQLVYVDHTN